MCRLFGYLGNDPSLLPLALRSTAGALVEACDVPGEGSGIGFYQDDRPLVRKRPKTLVDRVDFTELTDTIRSRSVIGQLRRGSRGKVSSENTPPFRFRNWLFANQGEIAHSDPAHNALRERLPDFLLRNIHGQTDSELALHLFFDHLRKNANIENPVVSAPLLAEALQSTIGEVQQMMRATGQERPPEFNMLYLSGRVLMACQYQSEVPLAYLQVEGLQEREQPLFAGHEPRTVKHEHFRGVFVAFDPHGEAKGWEPVPSDSLLIVDERLNVHILPINRVA